MRRVRIGIDVGGTFTHAVALDATTLEILGKAKVPTTHHAEEGVARGVVDSLHELLDQCDLQPDEIVLIAHSTTQATNALLEGDVAEVGILAIADGVGAVLARRQTAIRAIELAPGKQFAPQHAFLHRKEVTPESIDAILKDFVSRGVEVVVAAEAFSVDDPTNETLVCERARALGLLATATSQVSQLHGLAMRTRTAVINAAMIPRMLRTAETTESAVRAAGIQAPLMIMRSDGGVMDIEQMRRRPILTMLSGPAASVAAALLYARVSDGLLLEVGGTSTDISVIKNGRCQIRTAEVGGHKLHISALDVRTVGVAGGSLVYLDGDSIRQVGPRSSHIAGVPYLSFHPMGEPPEVQRISFDGGSALGVRGLNASLAITPTCCSNQLGLVPDGDAAEGNRAAIDAGLRTAAKALGQSSPEALADQVLHVATRRVLQLVEGLVADYKLDAGLIRLIGGGGGASAIVPYVAHEMQVAHERVENADVLAAIGVALALVRDTVERTVIDPDESDLRAIREEAYRSVRAMGAAPETIEVFVEVDAKRNLLRATAEGSTEIRTGELQRDDLSESERNTLVRTSLPASAAEPDRVFSSSSFEVWSATHRTRQLWLWASNRTALRVLDTSGKIRWATNHGAALETTAGNAEQALTQFAEQFTHYSDAGATIPRCFILLGPRIIDFSGLVEMEQVLELMRLEIKGAAGDTPVALLLDRAN